MSRGEAQCCRVECARLLWASSYTCSGHHITIPVVAVTIPVLDGLLELEFLEPGKRAEALANLRWRKWGAHGRMGPPGRFGGGAQWSRGDLKCRKKSARLVSIAISRCALTIIARPIWLDFEC